MLKYLVCILISSFALHTYAMDQKQDAPSIIHLTPSSTLSKSYVSISKNSSSENLIEKPENKPGCFDAFLHACLKSFALSQNPPSPYSR